MFRYDSTLFSDAGKGLCITLEYYMWNPYTIFLLY